VECLFHKAAIDITINNAPIFSSFTLSVAKTFFTVWRVGGCDGDLQVRKERVLHPARHRRRAV
jgi:hypothetical protein